MESGSTEDIEESASGSDSSDSDDDDEGNQDQTRELASLSGLSVSDLEKSIDSGRAEQAAESVYTNLAREAQENQSIATARNYRRYWLAYKYFHKTKYSSSRIRRPKTDNNENEDEDEETSSEDDSSDDEEDTSDYCGEYPWVTEVDANEFLTTFFQKKALAYKYDGGETRHIQLNISTFRVCVSALYNLRMSQHPLRLHRGLPVVEDPGKAEIITLIKRILERGSAAQDLAERKDVYDADVSESFTAKSLNKLSGSGYFSQSRSLKDRYEKILALTMFFLSVQTASRGKDIRCLLLQDITSVIVDQSTPLFLPDGCKSSSLLRVLFRQEKSNKKRHRLFSYAMRHRNVDLCSIGWLAQLLFLTIGHGSNNMLEFTVDRSWMDMYIFLDFHGKSIDAKKHREIQIEILKELGLGHFRVKLHI